LLLGIFAAQSKGDVIPRKPNGANADALSKAMNGPNGLRIRIGLAILLVLLILLGFCLLEPANLSERLLRLRSAA
jgi:hypothetical protein